MGKLDKQSEHLTDAQIEQYGLRTTGPAGTSQDQHFEAHLAECESCRGRVLAAARSHLTRVTDKSVTTAARPDCPTEDQLRDLAAGICPPGKVPAILQHVSQCDHCGPILRMFTEDFDEDLSTLPVEDQDILGKLKSSSPSWQKNLVREMQSGSAARPSGFWLRWLLVPATAAACAAIAFSVWYNQRETPEKVEKLFAQAYTEHRTMEMRWPEAEWADFKQTRSGETASLLNTPEALRKAASVVSEHLKNNPDDPQWLLLSARLDLLDWHYKSALSALRKIDDDKSLSSDEVRTTLALALYERAEFERDQRDQSYGEIVELLGKVLQHAPRDPVARFNRAVACERLRMYACASTDYQSLIELEKGSGWAAEAHEHIGKINEIKKNDQ